MGIMAPRDDMEDDNISNISVKDEVEYDDDDTNVLQQDNSINAEYEIQFQNQMHGRIDTRERESTDFEDGYDEDVEEGFTNPGENSRANNDLSLESDESEELVTYGERVDVLEADDHQDESMDLGH